MMTSMPGAYSESEFSLQLFEQLRNMISRPEISPAGLPAAVLLGGQSGAGKTTLQKVFIEKFDHNAIVINGDEFRALHPRFRELHERYGDDAVTYTASWSGHMVERLIEELSRVGYNLIIEGTLRTSEVPLSTAALLRERGYRVSLALMAVKPDISLLSCQARYEEMRIAGTTPRATDPAHHMRIVDQIVSNLAVLEDSGAFEDIELYGRSEERFYPADGEERRASQVLSDILFGEWTEEESAHRAFLEQYLEGLRRR